MRNFFRCLLYGHDFEIIGGASQWVDYECRRCGRVV